ncbi:hypothetical protein JCM8202_000639 [Rhodotorula sphaerocarpa]
MAWRCTGKTNEALVNNLAHAGILKTPRVIEAFHRIDRAHYVSEPDDAYRDSPTYIGYGATISAPHMHAHALENIEPFLKPGANVLDVGSGSGYLCGLFHLLVQPGGTVLGIDHLPELVDLSRRNIAKDPVTAPVLCPEHQAPVSEANRQQGKTLQVITADGRKGAPEGFLPPGGFQAIHVGAAAPRMPEALVEQLASPGRMFIPVGDFSQDIWQVDKDAHGTVTKKRLFGVSYVPLTDAQDQYDGAR